MNLDKARKLRDKYLPIVKGKTLVQNEDKGVTDIEIVETKSFNYELRVVHHPNPNLNPHKLHRDLKKFLSMHNIPFDKE